MIGASGASSQAYDGLKEFNARTSSVCVYSQVMSVLLRRNICRLLQHWHMPGFRGDAREPAPDRRKHREIIVAMVRDVRICIKRNVGDRIAIRHDVAMPLEMALQHAERA